MTTQFYFRKCFSKSFQSFLQMKSLKFFSFLLLFVGAFNVHGQTITGLKVNPSTICAGGEATLTFTLTNGVGSSQHFTTASKYILYYSSGGAYIKIDQFGYSTAPVGDGSSMVQTRTLRVPASFVSGTNYRVSMGSINPNIDGSTGANASAKITINGIPKISYSKVFASSCGGGTDGSISVTASGGQAPYTYTWTGYPVASSYSANTPAIDNLALGDYTIVVKDANQCSAKVPGITIKEAPVVTVGYSTTTPTCAGNDGALNVYRVGGVYDGITPIQYKIDGPVSFPYQNNGSFTGLVAGDYTVTAKDSKGCIGTALVNLPANTSPAPSVGISKKTNPGCSFNDGTISAFRISGVANQTSPVQFKVEGPTNVPYQSSGDFSNLSAGNYTVTVKDSRGCTGSLPVVLTQSEPLSFTPNGYNTNVSACGGGNDGSTTVTVTGGVQPYHFMLNGVEKEVRSYGTYTIGGLQPNVSYSVSVADSKGCTISKNVMVMQELAPTAIIAYKGRPTCMGGNDGFISVGHTGGVPGYSYSNDGGMTYQGSYVFYNLAPSTYDIIVKDSKGCMSAPVAVPIADGSGICVAERQGNMANTNNESRIGTKNSGVVNHSEPLLNSSLAIQTYPNPFASDFTLNVNGNTQDKVSIVVTDITGRRIYQAHGNANTQYKLGRELAQGIYILQVMQGNEIQTIKIVKE
jgi:hypothetical protein